MRKFAGCFNMGKLRVYLLCSFCTFFSLVLRGQNTTTAAGPVVAFSLNSYRNAVSASMGNTSLSALYNELSFVNNIAQLPLSNKTWGVGLSYTPWFPSLPLENARWFFMNLESYYVLGENYYSPSTERLAAIYECYESSSSRLRDIRGRRLSIKENGYVLRRQALSLKTSYYSKGSILVTDAIGTSYGTATPFEWSLALGYAINLVDNFSMGVVLRYLQSTIYTPATTTGVFGGGFETHSSNTISGDLYFLYDIGFKDHNRGGVSVGLTIANIGTKVEYDNGLSGYQPAYLGLATSWTNIYSPDHAFHLSAEIKKSLVHQLPNQDLINAENLRRYSSVTIMESLLKSFEDFSTYTAGIGVQYIYKETLSLRAGAEWNQTPFNSSLRGTTGLGYAVNQKLNFHFSYWIPFSQHIEATANTWSISASIQF